MPSSFNNKQSFGEKMKDEKLRRSYILTAVALCIALLIITVTAVIANRSKDPAPLPDNETEKSTIKQTESEKNRSGRSAPLKFTSSFSRRICPSWRNTWHEAASCHTRPMPWADLPSQNGSGTRGTGA